MFQCMFRSLTSSKMINCITSFVSECITEVLSQSAFIEPNESQISQNAHQSVHTESESNQYKIEFKNTSVEFKFVK
eukprot:399234-Amphidinium_carterae.1